MADQQEAEWIAVLRKHAESHKQKGSALAIGYSAAVVNQVLKGTYNGDLKSVQHAVEGALMGATVECPVVGEMPRNRCLEHQTKPFRNAATNPMRVALSRACPACPNRRAPK